jgi:hypothetical protein
MNAEATPKKIRKTQIHYQWQFLIRVVVVDGGGCFSGTTAVIAYSSPPGRCTIKNLTK